MSYTFTLNAFCYNTYHIARYIYYHIKQCIESCEAVWVFLVFMTAYRIQYNDNNTGNLPYSKQPTPSEMKGNKSINFQKLKNHNKYLDNTGFLPYSKYSKPS